MNEIVVYNNRLNELEDVIGKNLKAFYEVGSALMEIRESKLYKQDYDTFEDYCRDRWDMGRNYAKRLVHSSEVINNLKSVPIGTVLPETESQTRPLTRLSPPLQIEAWEKVVETAPDGKITARYVSKVVCEITNENIRKEVNKKSIRAKAIIKEEMVDEDFKRAFDAFYWEVQRTRLENWKTTSKKASLRLLSLIQDLIEVN